MPDQTPKRLSVQAVRSGILEMRAWREANNSQAAMHIVHLLAAKRVGAKPGVAIPYTEQEVDFAFCDSYLKVNESDHPYYDPFNLEHRIASHPHSNVATARKKTFCDSWKAGSFKEVNGIEEFTLAPDYLSTLVDKMKKGGVYTQLNPVALASWLYRERDFDLGKTAADLANVLRTEFGFSNTEWDALFVTPSPAEIAPFDSWHQPSSPSTSKLMIEVLAKDVPGFNLHYSLLALREAEKMPILTVETIVKASEALDCNQIVLQGPPGTGKTYMAKEFAKHMMGEDLDKCRSDLITVDATKRWGILQFHPSYGYEDFVQRQLPVTDGNGGVSIQVRNMPFVIACKTALAAAPRPFVLIIDELNRSDLHKVFGELMYALEYRGEPVTLQYSDAENPEPLVVPKNLYLIGTMNTADSSVVQVDYAIRRRFVFLDAPADVQILESGIADAQARKTALALFVAANAACGSSFRFAVGHTFFLKPTIEAIVGSFVFQVLPTLRAYQENGLIPEDAGIVPDKWESGPIIPNQARADVLVESLIAWAATL